MSTTIKDALKRLAACLWAMFHDFVTSKKVLTAILTAVAGVLIKDPAQRDHIVEIGIVLLGAQGVTDFGKARAAIAAKEPTLFPPPAGP